MNAPAKLAAKKADAPNNTALWDELGKTDPKHTKGFKRAGGFEGTALKPIWVERKLTEIFGPCGLGWGTNPPTYIVQDGANGESLVFCQITGWYIRDDERCEVHGVGGDKIIRFIAANEKYNRPARHESNDEAFKMAATDATLNAFKHVGAGADIHMGLFDDSKYVAELRDEFERASQPEQKPPAHSALKTAVREFVRQLHGCGDLDQYIAFVELPESKELIGEVREKLPAWFDGWDEQPDGFTPLGELLAKRRTELEALENV